MYILHHFLHNVWIQIQRRFIANFFKSLYIFMSNTLQNVPLATTNPIKSKGREHNQTCRKFGFNSAGFNNFLFFVSEPFREIEQGTKWPIPNQNWIKTKKYCQLFFKSSLDDGKWFSQ